MAQTKIEWTNATWNPVAGCALVSAGCKNCYAMQMAARLEAMGCAKYAGLTRKRGGKVKWTGQVRCDETALSVPLRWKKPRMIFVNSMSDLFHPDVPPAFIRRVWQVMADTPHHIYQILTKRPAKMAVALIAKKLPVLPNVWLGTSIENSAPRTLTRAYWIRQTPAALRFVSFEPLLETVNQVDLTRIDWAIAGGESGADARPMEVKWARDLRDRCGRAGIPFFFKQWGKNLPAGQQKGLLDGVLHHEFPRVEQ